MKNSKFGFTLIELLIVIALLGALAVGLLAALDPFEQLKKGTDTGVRNTTQEIQGAAIRYFAIKGYMPWCPDANDCGGPTSGDLDNATVSLAIDNMVAAGELKSNFMDLADAYKKRIFVTGLSSPDSPSMKVCFLPQARSFKADPNTKYTVTGVEVGDPTQCVAHTADGKVVCYWCIM